MSLALPGTPERPIKGAKEDGLGREPFVRRVVEALIDSRARRATGVVLGITGPWGSGKSSVLNMIDERVRRTYPEAVVIKFDPWLVSGRDDLLGTFLRDFLKALAQKAGQGPEWRRAAATVAEYAQAVAPTLKDLNATAGGVAGLVGWVASKFSNTDNTLAALKQRVETALAQVKAPIIILVDELDRVEEAEIRTVVQVVRAVVDFRMVSYVVAYDRERVEAALSSNHNSMSGPDLATGRAYLEKIIQHNLALPTSEPAAMRDLLQVELAPLVAENLVPTNFARGGAFNEMISVCMPAVLKTPRDIKRTVGQFKVVARMTEGEVLAADIFGFAALQSKAPDLADKIREQPDLWVEDPRDREAYSRLAQRYSGRESEALLPSDTDPGVAALAERLFPAIKNGQAKPGGFGLPISRRFALGIVLRGGLANGEISREEIEEILRVSRIEVTERLKRAQVDNKLLAFIDRVDELYAELAQGIAQEFWLGCANYLADPIATGDLRTLLAKRSVAESLGRLLVKAGRRKRSLREYLVKAVHILADTGDVNIVSEVLRLHFFMYGLYDARDDGAEHAILSSDEVQALAGRLAAEWKTWLTAGSLLPNLVNTDPLWIVEEVEKLSGTDRVAVTKFLLDEALLERTVVLLFGETHAAGSDTIAKIFIADEFYRLVNKRLTEVGRYVEPNLDEDDDGAELNQDPEPDKTLLRIGLQRAVELRSRVR